jgi:hypothetical protein
VSEFAYDADGRLVAAICWPGCCKGCWRCYGMSLGCHQEPCRCDKPCICHEPDNEGYDKACLRHSRGRDRRMKDSPPAWYSGRRCPTCDPDEKYISKDDCPTCDGSGTIMKAKADYADRCIFRTGEYKNCEYSAVGYVALKTTRQWTPVCRIHAAVYKRRGNIMEAYL